MSTLTIEVRDCAQMYRDLLAEDRPLTLVFHVWPHLDEVMAAWVLCWLFPKKFSYERIEFWGCTGVQTPDGRPWWDHVAEGKIILGRASGTPFDEHAYDGISSDKDNSCAMRVAKFFKVESHPMIADMVAWTNTQDQTGHGTPMDIAKINRAMFRTGWDAKEVIRWSFAAFDAMALHRSSLPKSEPVKPKLVTSENPGDGKDWRLVFENVDRDSLVAAWLLRKYRDSLGLQKTQPVFVSHSTSLGKSDVYFGTPDGKFSPDCVIEADETASLTEKLIERFGLGDNKALAQVRRWLAEPSHASPMDAMNVLPCLLARSVDKQRTLNWFFVALDARVQADEEFQTTIKQVEDNPKLFKKRFFNLLGKSRFIASAVSDSPAMATALRLQGAAITLQKNPASGNVFISLNQRAFGSDLDQAKLCMVEVLAELRQEEAKLLGENLPEEVLRHEGSISQQPHWFYYEPLGMVSNGTETAPDVPATGLSLGKIADIIRTHFTRTERLRDPKVHVPMVTVTHTHTVTKTEPRPKWTKAEYHGRFIADFRPLDAAAYKVSVDFVVGDDLKKLPAMTWLDVMSDPADVLFQRHVDGSYTVNLNDSVRVTGSDDEVVNAILRQLEGTGVVLPDVSIDPKHLRVIRS